VGSFSEDRPLGWVPAAAGGRAGDGMARVVSEEEASRLMTVYNNQYNQKAEATLQLLRLFLCLKN
jgi:hypothetical protein